MVNTVGCFLIGMLMAQTKADSTLKLLLITGFCGGFTTFSTFSAENFQLLQAGNITGLLINILASVLLGIVAVFVGLQLAKG